MDDDLEYTDNDQATIESPFSERGGLAFTEEELAASVPELVDVGQTFSLMLDISKLNTKRNERAVWVATFTWIDDFQALFNIQVESRRQDVPTAGGGMSGYLAWQADNLLIAMGFDEYSSMVAVDVPHGLPGYDPDRDHCDFMSEGWVWRDIAGILVRALYFEDPTWPRMGVGESRW